MNDVHICLFGAKDKGEDSRSIRLISEAAKRLGIEFSNLVKGNLCASIDNNGLTFFARGFDLSKPDAYIFRGVSKMIDPIHGKISVSRQMSLFAQYAHESLDKVIIDEALIRPNPTYTKFTDSYNLQKNNVPIIPTWIFMTTAEVKRNIELLPFPIIIKPLDGARGKNVFFYQTKEALLRDLKSHFSKVFYPFMIQQNIPNDGDYRIVVIKDKVIAAIKKHRSPDNVVANMSAGNLATPITISQELAELAIKAAQSLHIEFAGVDIIEDIQTGKKYILEVNISPQIYLSSQFSETDIAEHLLRHTVEKVQERRKKHA